jgi:hypothetical protein
MRIQKILLTVRANGRLYGPGDEAAANEVCQAWSLEWLAASGVIVLEQAPVPDPPEPEAAEPLTLHEPAERPAPRARRKAA